MSGGFKFTLAIIFVVASIFFYVTNQPNNKLTPEEEAKARRSGAGANIKPRDPVPASDAAPAPSAPPAAPVE